MPTSTPVWKRLSWPYIQDEGVMPSTRRPLYLVEHGILHTEGLGLGEVVA